MKKRKSPLVRDLWDNRIKWLMVLPAAIVVILMCYIPMAGIVLAFKEFNYYDGVFGSPWVGLENFQYFFKSGKAWLVSHLCRNDSYLLCRCKDNHLFGQH